MLPPCGARGHWKSSPVYLPVTTLAMPARGCNAILRHAGAVPSNCRRQHCTAALTGILPPGGALQCWLRLLDSLGPASGDIPVRAALLRTSQQLIECCVCCAFPYGSSIGIVTGGRASMPQRSLELLTPSPLARQASWQLNEFLLFGTIFRPSLFARGHPLKI